MGGKLFGVGGGGFMMFFVFLDVYNKIKVVFLSLIYVNCNIGSEGSKVVSYEYYE